MNRFFGSFFWGSLILVVSPSAQASWTLTVTCNGTSACGPITNTQFFSGFPTESACLAQGAAVVCNAVCSGPCVPCSVTGKNYSCAEATGGGPKVSLPGSTFLPGGTLLPQSQFDQIAGGFYGMGDLSFLGADFGDAFFSPHYTDSFQRWAEEFQRRLAAARAAGQKTGDDAPSFFSGTKDPPSTKKYENGYIDELASSDFFKRLQTGQSGPDPISGRDYRTYDEVVRERLTAGGNASFVTDGLPVDYSLPAQSQLDGASGDTAVNFWKEEAQKTGQALWDASAGKKIDEALAQAGLTDQVDRVKEGGGIFSSYAIGLEKTFEEMTNAALAGDVDAANSAWEKMFHESKDFQNQTADFVAADMKKAIGNAMGEFVELDFVGKEAKAAFDQGLAMAEDAKAALSNMTQKILEAKKAGLSDAAAFQDAAQKFAKEKIGEKAGELFHGMGTSPFKKDATEKLLGSALPSREAQKSK